MAPLELSPNINFKKSPNTLALYLAKSKSQRKSDKSLSRCNRKIEIFLQPIYIHSKDNTTNRRKMLCSCIY